MEERREGKIIYKKKELKKMETELLQMEKGREWAGVGRQGSGEHCSRKELMCYAHAQTLQYKYTAKRYY